MLVHAYPCQGIIIKPVVCITITHPAAAYEPTPACQTAAAQCSARMSRLNLPLAVERTLRAVGRLYDYVRAGCPASPKTHGKQAVTQLFVIEL
jgi:hypothetical protein